MKIGPQVYVRGSIEAVEMYCKAFGAEITCSKNSLATLFAAQLSNSKMTKSADTAHYALTPVEDNGRFSGRGLCGV